MEIRTTGQLRAALGRLLARVEAGTIDANEAAAACKIASAINQTFAEETKAMLAAKELGLIKPAFGHTLIGEPDLADSPQPEVTAQKTTPASKSIYTTGITHQRDAGGRDFADA
jgi:hypothetical protein